ncbi:MAG: hypothetical protein CMO80_21865 [Verrucomicrobiales bacterium]|nr:hypothetical protein [Verrucomicrobiales bacterium]
MKFQIMMKYRFQILKTLSGSVTVPAIQIFLMNLIMIWGRLAQMILIVVNGITQFHSKCVAE